MVDTTFADPDLEAEFRAWLAEEYVPITGGWHY